MMPRAHDFLRLVESPLAEGQDIYYHVTNGATEILRGDQFVLTNAMLRGEKGAGHDLDRPFYMSLARSRINRYRGSGDTCLVLDGQKLGQRHKIVPFDYWHRQREFGTGRGTGESETEDRLLSQHQTIPNAKDYILEIHIYVNAWNWKSKEIAYGGLKADAGDIPLFVYTDWTAFRLLDKRRAMDIDWEHDMGGVAEGPSEWAANQAADFRKLVEFLETGQTDDTTYWGDNMRALLRRDAKSFADGVMSKLHNSSTVRHPDMVELQDRVVKMMREEGAQGPHEFLMRRFERLRGLAPAVAV